MANRTSASIAIGGSITTHEALETLVEALEAEAVGVDWMGPPSNGWEAEILERAAAGQPVRATGQEVPGGMFEDLEATCRELGLSYLRQDDGYTGEWAPGSCVFRPGVTPEPVETEGGDDTGPAVALDRLAGWVEAGTLEAEVRALLAIFAPIPPLVVAPDVLAALAAEDA